MRHPSLVAVSAFILGTLIAACVGVKAIAHAQMVSSTPAVTSVHMTVANTATAVPAACMQPRQAIEICNSDAVAIFCGPSTVTAAVGATQGRVIPAGTAAIPNCVTFNVGCFSTTPPSSFSPPTTTLGNIFCISAAGTAANAVGVTEYR